MAGLKSKPDADAPLQEHVDWWQTKKYRVLVQTGSNATLIKSRLINFDWAFVQFVLLAIGILVYLFFFSGKKADLIDLSVVGGEVQTEKSRSRPPNVPEPASEEG